mmetsp:Transcript_41243/g.66903  ORF Transcript_41243/g.66903 Transcript_41243/m.66903 type:complete len:84 (-) Transcript_41243:844-1095(-)
MEHLAIHCASVFMLYNYIHPGHYMASLVSVEHPPLQTANMSPAKHTPFFVTEHPTIFQSFAFYIRLFGHSFVTYKTRNFHSAA